MDPETVRFISPRKKIVFLVIIGLVLIIVGARFFGFKSNLTKVKIGNHILAVEIAKTEAEQQQGLSGRDFLAPNQGMLFWYPTKVLPGFWMKDMKFALDFIWVADGVVVELAQNIEPPPVGLMDKNLAIYRPGVLVNWVIEVPAGWVATNQIKIGDLVILK
ncbi:MAG: DUF192 domain-containing protein [Candidatus Buchananbacteria bacterium]